MAIAGRVAIVPKGEWSQDVTYDKLDLVTRNGNTFIAYKSSVGVEPVDGDTWMLVMQGIDPQDIENIINGTTPVGNANKLGGKEPSEYVTDADIEALRKWVGSGKEVTDCNTLEVGSMGYCYPNATNAPFSNASAIIFTFGVSESYKTQIAISNGRRIKVRNCIEGSWSAWSDETTTTADLANYLPLDGGGIITKSANAVLQLKNPSAERAYLGFIGSNTLGYLGFEGVDMPSFKTKAGAINTLLHTGNKPTGTYTGNGSATSRTINVGGIGSALLLRCNELYTLIVSNSGAFGYAYDGRTLISLPYNEINFTNGVLTIATTSAYVNGSSYPYKYDLL